MDIKSDSSKTKNLKHVKIYNELYELIQNGTYAPGTQLPPETTLAATMNVSRMTLRKALTLLREDGLLKAVPGVGHFVRTTKATGSHANEETKYLLSSDSGDNKAPKNGSFQGYALPHPIYDCCQETLDNVELDFRIEPPSKSMLDIFDHYTAAVVIVDRWYKHEENAIAYSLSFIPIEFIGKLHIDLNTPDELLEFLDHTCYEKEQHCSRCITFSTAGNFTAKNYKLSSYDSFLLTQENIYNADNEILVFNKHYIPTDVFKLEIAI